MSPTAIADRTRECHAHELPRSPWRASSKRSCEGTAATLGQYRPRFEIEARGNGLTIVVMARLSAPGFRRVNEAEEVDVGVGPWITEWLFA